MLTGRGGLYQNHQFTIYAKTNDFENIQHLYAHLHNLLLYI